MTQDPGQRGALPPTPPDAAAEERDIARASRQGRDGNVPPKAVQEQEQMHEAVVQMGAPDGVAINEGGRTNDSRHQDNPPGAVHGLPTPALKGTWR